MSTIKPDALILTGCVCFVIATCVFIRVCSEWLARVDEDHKSQKFRDKMAYDTKCNTEQIRTEIKKLCEKLGIDVDNNPDKPEGTD